MFSSPAFQTNLNAVYVVTSKELAHPCIEGGCTMVISTLYLDTEFTSLSIDRGLISLALVSADGAENYVELLDGWSEDIQ